MGSLNTSITSNVKVIFVSPLTILIEYPWLHHCNCMATKFPVFLLGLVVPGGLEQLLIQALQPLLHLSGPNFVLLRPYKGIRNADSQTNTPEKPPCRGDRYETDNPQSYSRLVLGFVWNMTGLLDWGCWKCLWGCKLHWDYPIANIGSALCKYGHMYLPALSTKRMTW